MLTLKMLKTIMWQLSSVSFSVKEKKSDYRQQDLLHCYNFLEPNKFGQHKNGSRQEIQRFVCVIEE